MIEGEGERPREGQDELAVGGRGKDPVDQVGGGVGHAPAPATRTQAALATEGDEALMAAGGAAQAGDAAGEQAALEVPAELAFDEARIAGPRVGA